MYPLLREGVSIGTFQYEDSDTIHYFVKNKDDDEFEVSYPVWDALMHADGTHPLDLPNEGQELLQLLKKYHIIQTNRFVHNSGIHNQFILFNLGRTTRRTRRMCRKINTVLPVLAVVILIIGVCLKALGGLCAMSRFNWILYFSLFVFSLALHETGHLIAGISYKYKISNVGILLSALSQ